ncbi:MAG: hypothetical protein AWU57_1514 [Marinobacter sp. T13-3]|nr:MAG: hypothetical protein AWU57_1514 [Marinobacter sp. T13-3]
MDYKDVPREEIEAGSYSRETITALLGRARREYRKSISRSVAKNVPLLLGTYLAVCACLAGYALAHGESIWLFAKIYVALLWLWIPVGAMLPVTWVMHRPTESTVKEELDWYSELLKSSGRLQA